MYEYSLKYLLSVKCCIYSIKSAFPPCGILLCRTPCIIINKYSRHTHVYLVQSKHLHGLCYGFKITDKYIHTFFCKYIHIIHRNTQTQYKQTCSCTQMFPLCGNRTRDLLRSRRVFPPLRQIGRQIIFGILFPDPESPQSAVLVNGKKVPPVRNGLQIRAGEISTILEGREQNYSRTADLFKANSNHG
jgi:hypothetical protein